MFMITAIISCSKESTDGNELDLLKKATAITQLTASLPTSEGGTVPYLIPGVNPGGNRTCAEVATAWKLNPNPFLCGEKIDYSYGGFADEFPSGLSVITDGQYVSFKLENCILIGDKYYKVGAVIVKGSNAANVYYYPDGTTGDSGLAGPLNRSGNPAGLSNLTFCFVECEEELPELVIVLKTYMMTPTETWAGTVGVGSEIDILRLGYLDYEYNGENSFKIFKGAYSTMPIGTLKASDYYENNIHYLEIVITGDVESYLFERSYLYVGSAAGYSAYLELVDGITYTHYGSFPFFEDELMPTRTFKIPFSEITE
jgi:hypothetical protein